MAAGNVLKIEYYTGEGSVVTHSWKYAESSLETSKVKALATATIENGSIFAKVPVSVKSAALEVTTSSEYDLT